MESVELLSSHLRDGEPEAWDSGTCTVAWQDLPCSKSHEETLLTLLIVMWQPGWEGSLGENRDMCMNV